MKIFNLIIISRNKYINDLSECFNAGWNGCEQIKDEEALSAINPVINDLENVYDNEEVLYYSDLLMRIDNTIREKK